METTGDDVNPLKEETQGAKFRKYVKETANGEAGNRIADKFIVMRGKTPEPRRKQLLSPYGVMKLKKKQATQLAAFRKVSSPHLAVFKKILGGKSRVVKSRSKTPTSDRIKVLNLRHMLQKQRMQNQLEKFKIQRRIQSLRSTGRLGSPMELEKLKQMIPLQVIADQRYFNDGITDNEVDSAFNADIGHGDSLFGTESYFKSDDYYGEEYYSDEDLVGETTINFNRRGSPLFC